MRSGTTVGARKRAVGAEKLSLRLSPSLSLPVDKSACFLSHLIDILVATVIALERKALRVLVREARAEALHHRLGREVLRSK